MNYLKEIRFKPKKIAFKLFHINDSIVGRRLTNWKSIVQVYNYERWREIDANLLLNYNSQLTSTIYFIGRLAKLKHALKIFYTNFLFLTVGGGNQMAIVGHRTPLLCSKW